MYAASNGKYSLFVVEDDDFSNNPRNDDCVGRMVCWHKRYALGDKHDYNSPTDFLKDLYRKSIDSGRHIFSYISSGRANNAKLEYDIQANRWDLSERLGEFYGWCLTDSAAPEQIDMKDWFFDAMLDAMSVMDLHNLLEDIHNYALLPLYLYDHGGITMRTSDFGDPFDSGQVGYIYADSQMIENKYGECTLENIQCAERALGDEVELYDMFLSGQCYGFYLYKDGKNIDSCFGFLGSIDNMKDFVKQEMSNESRTLVDQLEWCDESIEACLWNHREVS